MNFQDYEFLYQIDIDRLPLVQIDTNSRATHECISGLTTNSSEATTVAEARYSSPECRKRDGCTRLRRDERPAQRKSPS